MANNCNNYITISGNKRVLSHIVKHMGEYDYYGNLLKLFNRENAFDTDGRWFDIDFEVYDDYIQINGDSAWSPCLELFRRISKRYKSLKIRYEYDEMGCDFAGYANIEDGELDDNCFPYWEGMKEINGEDDMLDMLIMNDLEYYVEDYTLIEFLNLNICKNFSEKNRIILIEEFNKLKNTN